MTTPLCDFIDRYAAREAVRLHMPGHKGASLTGCEWADITEIGGADSLYAPTGIIRESEQNAARLFGAADTLYSTEGSSQCIRAMVYLAALAFGEKSPGRRPVILAGRNAHKAFLTAAALVDVDVQWLYPENETYSLCRCALSPAGLQAALERTPEVAAVYVTSPDYLGNCADIAALAQCAHQHGVPLLVDNAHGAYQAFLQKNQHPMALGADLCCDSAHKTLPVLTGGAYLHLAGRAPEMFRQRARGAMALFGSTSPSYLTLRSLDRANLYLADGYPEKLQKTLDRLAALRKRLEAGGWAFAGDEPLKLTLDAKNHGCTGLELGAYLESQGIVYEYADPDFLVLMPTPENPERDLARLENALLKWEKRPALPDALPPFQPPKAVMSIREALFSPCEAVSVRDAVGRIAASPAAACPPAVSPVVPGEVLTADAVQAYLYYGIESVEVVTGREAVD